MLGKRYLDRVWLEDLEGLPEAVQSVIGNRKVDWVHLVQPWEDDDYTYVWVRYSKGRPTHHIFSGACLRPTIDHYQGQSFCKALRTWCFHLCV